MLVKDIQKLEPPFYLVKPSVSVEEYFELTDEDTLYELINGELIMHSPASFKHEKVFGFLFILMGTYISEKKLGELLGSRFAIKLSDFDIFEPDIIFIPNKMKPKINDKFLNGCPPLAVEILSSSTRRFDLGEKLSKYFLAGMKEYWVIEPEEKRVRIYSSKNQYTELKTGKIISKIIKGFWIKSEWFWELPSEKKCIDEILKKY